MKAEASQQRSLLDLAEVDAELRRVDHRAANLAEQQEFERVQALHREANDQLSVVGIALEDLDGEIAKLESEIDSVRQREERDRTLLQGGTVNAKQLNELQHELETLERRQASLEDSLLEVMERREELQRQQSEHLGRIDALQNELPS
jgi:predicted  nucleic acid-binding Zn-ribbon protein